MGIEVGSGSGIVREVNVVPLIDILLVLLVIFMIIPHRQVGLAASLTQEGQPVRIEHPESIIVQIGPEGAVRLNGSEVERAKLESGLKQVLEKRAERVAYLQGDRSLEFQVVAEVLDVMQRAGASPIGS
ncbi:MAG TPA: biopolymer transporter ExbD [Verrucomicrobiae bacterium]|nr:biopolymer transporter ExbD [Verrucomicrobiae bacterium]